MSSQRNLFLFPLDPQGERKKEKNGGMEDKLFTNTA